MNRTSYDMATFLELFGVGTVGKDIFASMDIPSKPDEILFLVDTGSYEADLLTFGPFSYGDISNVSFQVVARGKVGGVNSCYDKIGLIRNLLHKLPCRSVWPKKYVYTMHQFGPVELRLDENMRPSVSMNFTSKVIWYGGEGYYRDLKSHVVNETSAWSDMSS